jgi:alpha-galactosidase
MIAYNKEDKTFYLETKNTSYIFYINEHKHLEHIYYGNKVDRFINVKDHIFRYEFELGSSTSYSEESKGYQLNHVLLEYSTFGKGDYRNPSLHLELPSGHRTLDLQYTSHKLITDFSFDKMPQAKKTQTLEITLKDTVNNLEVKLYYSVFENNDIIVRNNTVINHNQEPIIIDKALSGQLDFLNKDYEITKLDGAWIRERHISKHQLSKGTISFDSKKGVSSSDHNPFVLIHDKTTMEDYGNVYGCALIYSGNFEANIEVSTHDLVRVQMGINSFDFRYKLNKNEQLITPELVLSYSGTGFHKISNNLHNFIGESIIKNQHKKDRPILINNWEATYFDFNEKKLLTIAKKAKKLGMELFCLDDGWFGGRNDDFSSLGDWYYNKKKLPRGVNGISKKINKMGLDFGIWVEPEMINMDSDLYREHPSWAIEIPNMKPSLGRNQLILDLSNPEVITYLKTVLTDLINSANISYIKWDMNRNFSDVFSQYLEIEDQGKFNHLYVLGLYDVLDYLVNEFPDILFESCSSDGNRFDMGMLYYMPQTWTSDNTDSYERMLIQEGTSYLYPLSSISNHVSGDVSHQVLRHTPLESRFNVACFGILGYELDLGKITPFESFVIEKQVQYYKEHRSLFQYGDFHRIKSIYDNNAGIWMVMNEEKDEALVLYYQVKSQPNAPFIKIPIKGLIDGTYKITGREQYMNVRDTGSLVNHVLPIKLKVNGQILNFIANRYKYKEDTLNKTMTKSQLENSELVLHHTFTGTGTNDSVMMLRDYSSKIIHIKREK